MWHYYQINLSNNMGGDANNDVKGIIHFNSSSYLVGTTPISVYREGTTFLYEGHNVRGEDNQFVGQYYRKWEKFSEEVNSSISIFLTSPNNYTRTATYSRRFDNTYQNYFNSNDNYGIIKFNDSQYNSPSFISIYEDSSYSLEAINQTHNSVYYYFDHWELNGYNIGSSNPLSFSPQPGNILQAVFNHKPVNSYRYLQFNDSDYWQPIKLKWYKHPLDNSFITQYQIWRKVKHNGVLSNPVQIATILANACSIYSYTDYDYLITNGYTDDLVYYDVKAYYSPNYSDDDYVAVYAKISPKNEENKNFIALDKELPDKFSVSNFPNPFSARG